MSVVTTPEGPLPGEVVILRQWQAADARWYVDSRDEEVFRWTKEPRNLTVEATRAAIKAVGSSATAVALAIADRHTGELLGNIALKLANGYREGEVMYWLAPGARGRGAATDGVRTIVAWAFDTLPLDRIELYTNPGNIRSQRVAIRAGFEPRGERERRQYFVLTRDEFERRPD